MLSVSVKPGIQLKLGLNCWDFRLGKASRLAHLIPEESINHSKRGIGLQFRGIGPAGGSGGFREPVGLPERICRRIFGFYFRTLLKKSIKQARKPFDSITVVRRIPRREYGEFKRRGEPHIVIQCPLFAMATR